MADLLSRGDFRRHVFDRDNGKCVICRRPAVDAHHIMDRKLWFDGADPYTEGEWEDES